jgi:F-type H+-transporting ATPase subunit epsilon
MKLKVLLPFRIFLEKENVQRLVAETSQGAVGIWPNRLDFAAELVPGLMSFETDTKQEVWLAVDEGIMVKAGEEVLVSVRNAAGGTDLGNLKETIRRDFLRVDEQEVDTRAALAKLESGFVRRFAEFVRD